MGAPGSLAPAFVPPAHPAPTVAAAPADGMTLPPELADLINGTAGQCLGTPRSVMTLQKQLESNPLFSFLQPASPYYIVFVRTVLAAGERGVAALEGAPLPRGFVPPPPPPMPMPHGGFSSGWGPGGGAGRGFGGAYR